MAVDGVCGEPLSGQIPDNREKYRELRAFSRGGNAGRSVVAGSWADFSLFERIRNREFPAAYQGIQFAC